MPTSGRSTSLLFPSKLIFGSCVVDVGNLVPGDSSEADCNVPGADSGDSVVATLQLGLGIGGATLMMIAVIGTIVH